jgi:NADH:ubiquinone oxidoreductase subunit E
MKKKIQVCSGRACKVFGADRIMEKISKELDVKPEQSNEKYELTRCGCTGYCGKAPNVRVDDNIVFSADEDTIIEEIKKGGESIKGKEIDVDVENF